MTRAEILSSPDYWIQKIQLRLYNCAEKFMKRTGKNRTQLAKHLGVSKGYVSQILNGDYNHRLSKFVELSISFGYIPQIKFVPIEEMLVEDKRYYTNKFSLESKYTGTWGEETLKSSDEQLKFAA